jgi:hypothetical protein
MSTVTARSVRRQQRKMIAEDYLTEGGVLLRPLLGHKRGSPRPKPLATKRPTRGRK